MSDELKDKFTEHWNSLARELGLSNEKSQEVYNFLLSKYSGKDRHYHSVRHIVSMLDGFELLKDKFSNPVAARLAIVFHDVIYDASKKDNEEQSANAMKKMLAGLVDQAILEKAAFTINATKEHKATPSNDTNLVIDIDMAILGQPWAVYERYASGVMQEYIPVYGEDAYRAGRPQFLDVTAGQESIFITDEFRHLDTQARKNMAQERGMLLEGKLFSGRAV